MRSVAAPRSKYPWGALLHERMARAYAGLLAYSAETAASGTACLRRTVAQKVLPTPG